jgi:hypothetical protein
MAMKIPYVIILLLMSIAPGTVVQCTRQNFVQTSCLIEEDHYALINMRRSDEPSKPGMFESDIQFGPDGIVVRFPPEWYGARWNETLVQVHFAARNSPTGILSVGQISSGQAKPRMGVVGTVQRSCWNQVRAYIQRKIVRRGIVVHLKATYGDEPRIRTPST